MKLRLFECENCEKRSEASYESPNCFPYDLGWIYIHKFSFKPDPEKIIEKIKGDIDIIQNTMRDLNSLDSGFVGWHFCSVNCTIEFIKKKLGGRDEK